MLHLNLFSYYEILYAKEPDYSNFNLVENQL